MPANGRRDLMRRLKVNGRQSSFPGVKRPKREAEHSYVHESLFLLYMGCSIKDRTSTSTDDDHVQRVRAVIRGNRRLTVREVVNEVGISIGSCHQILTEKLHMRRISAKFVD